MTKNIKIDFKKKHEIFTEDGFVEIKNFLDENNLNYLKKIVNDNLLKNNFNSFFLTGTNLDEAVGKIENFNAKILNVFNKFSELDKLSNYSNRKMYKVLRVISKSKMYSNSYDFHFDAHYYTMLVPIFIPEGIDEDTNGHLMLFPNIRKNTNNLMKNFFQKLFYQNKIIKNLLKLLVSKKKIKYTKLIIKPGNIYLFNGFRSLHANENVDKSLLRATLIVHFHDCFASSKIIQWNREYRKYIEKKNIEKNSNISNIK